jgi:putative phosphotransacetylase
MAGNSVPIEISARHVHLSQHDADVLFGPHYSFHPLKQLSQPQQFAAQETVKVIGPQGEFSAVRIIGPVREATQFELSITDGYALGIKPSVAVSGDLDASIGGVKVIGPVGKIVMNQGIIVAQRHLHIAPAQAAEWGIKHLDVVRVKTNGLRPVLFEDVVVRSREGIDALSFMIDTDEANAAGVQPGDSGELLI